MLQRFTAVLACVATALLLSITPVRAITNGVIDTEHPNVGAMGIDLGPDGSFYLCSGTLIAPNVFLVAAHCVAGPASFLRPDQFFVTFDDNFFTASTFVAASEVHFDPGWLSAQINDPHELGILVLSQDVKAWNGVTVVPADLPTAGLLDQLSARGGLRGTSFVDVGYGAAASFKGGPPSISFDGYRKASTSPFQALTPALLMLLMNSDATGEGGVCYVDSGSPKFLPGTNTTVAVQVGGDPNCRAWSFAYRLDTPEARAFLGQFVTLP